MSSAEADHSPRSTRRGFIRLLGVAGGATAAGIGSQATPYSPVQQGQAVAATTAAVVVGGSVAAGWVLREVDPLGFDKPPEGLTADGLTLKIYDATVARKSNNASTFIDNKNILDGLSHTAYADGKIAAIEALNDQKTQEEVQQAALDAANSYISTVEKNLLKSWNESVNQLVAHLSALDEHPDLNRNSVYSPSNDEYVLSSTDKTITLADGTTFDCKMVGDRSTTSGNAFWVPSEIHASNGDTHVTLSTTHGDVTYLNYDDWSPIWTEIQNTVTEVNDGLITWVDGVYGDVQSGDLDTGELLTPREQAMLASEDEDIPQAIADLQALNVAVDLERKATVHLPQRGATITGRLSTTGSGTLEVGDVDPSTRDASIYLTYDISKASGNWSDYESGVDGGIVTFTAEPYEGNQFTIETTAGETVTVTPDDFSHDEANGVWTVDLSGDLDNAITEIKSVTYSAPVDETEFETIQLTKPFTIKSFTDSQGNEHESASFERTKPQTDSNYITQEEWEKQQKRHEELIEKYEKAKSGTGAVTIGGMQIPPKYVGAALAVAAGLGLLK